MCLCMRSDMHIAVPGRILMAFFHAAKQIEFWNKCIQDFIDTVSYSCIFVFSKNFTQYWHVLMHEIDMHIAVPGRILG